MSRRGRLLLTLLALAALALACASSETLTRRSQQQLGRGDTAGAWDTALRALEKDPASPAAREALGAAGRTLLADERRRFENLYAVDTLGAAKLALGIEDRLRDMARLGADARADSAFVRDLAASKQGAAAALTRAGDAALRARRAREAYRLFQQVTDFAPRAAGIDERLRRAFDAAVERVAVLPLDDQIDEPELPRALADRLAAALRRAVVRQQLEFTRLVEPERVDERMTVSQLGSLSREEAVRLGRQVGAQVVLWGRLYGAGTDNNTTHWREPLWHRVSERGEDGKPVERWVQVPFEAVVRERVYHLRWELALLDTDEGEVLARDDQRREVRMRAVWTNFRPEDDPGNYALVPPEVRTQEPERAQRVEKAYGATVGKLGLKTMLEKAKAPNVSARSAYRHEYRGEFERHDPDVPVFMGGLPDGEDLAWIALRDIDDAFMALVRSRDAR